MLPFRVIFKPGAPAYLQFVYAAKKAFVRGQLRHGDRFPAIRSLSQELSLNPNTVQKAVTRLVEEGILEVRPGQGTFVADKPPLDSLALTALVEDDVEPVVVEARKLGMSLDDLLRAVKKQWSKLEVKKP